MAGYTQLQYPYLGKFLYLFIFCALLVTSESNKVILNTPEHCRSDDTTTSPTSPYKVSSDESYELTISKNSNFDCDGHYVATFTSSEKDGRICIIQNEKNEIRDHNGMFTAYGCHENDGSVCELEYFPNEWNWVEKCSLTPNVSFHLWKKNKNFDLELSKLTISVTVMSMESTQRKVYMDGKYCFRAYQLYKSEVSVFNSRGDDRPKKICRLVMQNEAIENSSICLIYKPPRQLDCSSNWTLSVSVGEYDLDPSKLVYDLNCYEINASKMHAWCSTKETRSVTLTYQIQDIGIGSKNSQFEFVVKDYVGNARDLLQDFAQQESHSADDTSSNSTIVTVIISCFGAVIGLLVIVFVCRRKDIYRKCREKQKDSRDKADPEESSDFMKSNE